MAQFEHLSNLAIPTSISPSTLIHNFTRASCQICKIAVAHTPGMPGTIFPPPLNSDPDMHHGTCVTTCRDACRDH